VLLHIKKKR